MFPFTKIPYTAKRIPRNGRGCQNRSGIPWCTTRFGGDLVGIGDVHWDPWPNEYPNLGTSFCSWFYYWQKLGNGFGHCSNGF